MQQLVPPGKANTARTAGKGSTRTLMISRMQLGCKAASAAAAAAASAPVATGAKQCSISTLGNIKQAMDTNMARMLAALEDEGAPSLGLMATELHPPTAKGTATATATGIEATLAAATVPAALHLRGRKAATAPQARAMPAQAAWDSAVVVMLAVPAATGMGTVCSRATMACAASLALVESVEKAAAADLMAAAAPAPTWAAKGTAATAATAALVSELAVGLPA